MTQNDYIAEYIKERHPSLLGTDFAIWKFGRAFAEATKKITDALKPIDWSEITQKLNEIEETEGKDEDVAALSE